MEAVRVGHHHDARDGEDGGHDLDGGREGVQGGAETSPGGPWREGPVSPPALLWRAGSHGRSRLRFCPGWDGDNWQRLAWAKNPNSQQQGGVPEACLA